MKLSEATGKFRVVQSSKSLDWRGWLLGLMSAAVSGASSAVGATLGVGVATDINLSLGQHLEVAGVAAAVSAIVSLAKYLQLHPTPES